MIRMLQASAYITLCSLKNRARLRLRRLREPRYLLGAVVAAAYLRATFFARVQGGRRGAAREIGVILAWRGGLEAVAAAALLALAAAAWLLPSDSTVFEPSPAETDFLLPAPVTRRALLVHRLIRSQISLLFGAVVSALFVPFAAAGRLRTAGGVYVLFLVMRVYVGGVSLARARSRAASSRARLVLWAPFGIALAAAGIVAASLARAVSSAAGKDAAAVLASIESAIAAGPAGLVLLPFKAIVRPLFAASPREFIVRLGGALLVLAAAVAWVLWSDDALEEVAEAGRARTIRDRRPALFAPGLRRVSLPLGPAGGAEMLLFWKNALQTLRGTNLAQVLPVLAPLAALAVAGGSAWMASAGARGPAAAFAAGAMGVAAFFVVVGPQIVRSDLRGDLPQLDLLKTWPVGAAAVLRGELLWPTTLLTAAAWAALACGVVFSEAAYPDLDATTRLSRFGAAFVLAPGLIAAQLTIHNGAAVLFPAWVPIGRQRPRGLDAMGQRLILFAGVLLSLVVMVGPGAIAGFLLVLLLDRFIGPLALVPAAVLCLAMIVFEIGAVTGLLAGAYDRVDLSEIEPPE